MGTPKVAGNGDIAFRLNLLGAKSMIIEFEKQLECKSNIGKPSIGRAYVSEDQNVSNDAVHCTATYLK